jgi:predicted O-methyltransferase YrrM
MEADPMDDTGIRQPPAAIPSILRDTGALGFDMISEPRVGALLAVLAASKPGGRMLELGTGTGHGAAWLLGGMDATSTLDPFDLMDADAWPGKFSHLDEILERLRPGGI